MLIESELSNHTRLLILQSTCWYAEIALEVGANLCRLVHCPTGLDVIRRPKTYEAFEAAPECYGIPVLFPPNRIADGRFVFNHREYVLPCNDLNRGNHIHGVMLRKTWQVIEQTSDRVLLRYELTAEEGYGHDCMLELHYWLDDAGLHQRMRVTNCSDSVMPIGLGYHTAFTMFPDSRMQATTVAQYWEILPPRALPTGRLLNWHDDVWPCTDLQPVSWHCPMSTGQRHGKSFNRAVITHTDKKLQVVYTVDQQFKHWYFWNDAGGKGFICAEPLSWMANALNMALPIEMTGVQALAPQATWSAYTRISVQAL
ncbi:MAG TPA: hypothetical protein DCM28_09570 [Phycisphaerales bacterium]|nr:hypothetical protein [Phycisphaerales bacterium]HCD32239.1 hypothetical protein [Phycisphaerales bacterium]|tara:strand:- start:267 stop:1205 length:939 start_codon:yes stop_codon:yes gene_type:complete